MAKPSRFGFDAGGLERGRYLVALLPEDDGDTDAPIALLPDQEVSGLGAQRFLFTFPTASLEGSVSSSASGMSANLRVLAVPEGLSGFAADFLGSPKAAESMGVPVDHATGSFRIEHLARGPHRLELWDTKQDATTPLAVRNVDVSGSQRLALWTY